MTAQFDPRAPALAVDGSRRLDSMDGLRGYAVLLVFSVHFLGAYFRREKGIDLDRFEIGDSHSVTDWFGYYLFSSHYGVDLFFLLSGFLICRMLRRPGFKYFNFLVLRFTRLYPAFFAAFVIWGGYQIVFHGKEYDALTIFGNLLFFHGLWELRIESILVPSWSLTFEWPFYLVFPLYFVLRKISIVSVQQVIALGTVAVATALLIGPDYVRFVMFFVGAALATSSDQTLRKLATCIPDWTVITVVVLVNAVFVFSKSWYFFSWIYAPASAALFLHTTFGGGILTKFFAAAPLTFFGRISYSFYLFHGIVVEILFDQTEGLATFNSIQGFLAFLLTAFGLSVAAGAVGYALFELPYFARRHRRARSNNTESDGRRGGREPELALSGTEALAVKGGFIGRDEPRRSQVPAVADR